MAGKLIPKVMMWWMIFILSPFFLLESILSHTCWLFYSPRLKGGWRKGWSGGNTRICFCPVTPRGDVYQKNIFYPFATPVWKHYVRLCWLHVEICMEAQTFDADSRECFRWGSMAGQFHHRSLLFGCHSVALFVDFFILSGFSFFSLPLHSTQMFHRVYVLTVFMHS